MHENTPGFSNFFTVSRKTFIEGFRVITNSCFEKKTSSWSSRELHYDCLKTETRVTTEIIKIVFIIVINQSDHEIISVKW